MKKINLRELNIQDVDFTFRISLTDDLLERIESNVKPDDDGDYVFVERYKADGVGHMLGAVMSKGKGEERYRVRVLCERMRYGKVQEGTVSVCRLFEIISSIKEEIVVRCMLRLSFSKRKKYKTMISLPMKITDMPDATYNEIHGMHFVKRAGNDRKYDFILDIGRDGTITAAIHYGKRVKIQESIMEDIVKEGMGICNSFVVGKEK